MKKLILTTILMCLPFSLMAKEFIVVSKMYAYQSIENIKKAGRHIIDIKLDEAENGYCVIIYE